MSHTKVTGSIDVLCLVYSWTKSPNHLVSGSKAAATAQGSFHLVYTAYYNFIIIQTFFLYNSLRLPIICFTHMLVTRAPFWNNPGGVAQ